MSHLVEQYAKVCGVNIGNPIIKEHYYPIIHDKYITVHSDAKDQARSYSHWAIVLRLLKKPLSDIGIKIIQIGGNEAEELPFIDQKITNCTYKNTFYIIKNSILHLGINSLPVHIASAYNKKIVNIFGNLYPECAFPYWSKKKDVVNLSPDFSKVKPSFAKHEKEKRIDEIKPETIAQSVLDLLKIPEHISFNTILFGEFYTKANIDVVPNNSKTFKNKNINIRMDKFFNLKELEENLKSNKCEVTTRKKIPKKYLNSKNLLKINYISDHFNEKFVKQLKKHNIKYSLICDKENKISEQRARFFDEEVDLLSVKSISKKYSKQIKDINLKEIKILSYRKILHKDKIYSSYYEISKEKEDLLLDLNNIMIYSQ